MIKCLLEYYTDGYICGEKKKVYKKRIRVQSHTIILNNSPQENST